MSAQSYFTQCSEWSTVAQLSFSVPNNRQCLRHGWRWLLVVVVDPTRFQEWDADGRDTTLDNAKSQLVRKTRPLIKNGEKMAGAFLQCRSRSFHFDLWHIRHKPVRRNERGQFIQLMFN